MNIVVLDSSPASRATLVGRVQEAVRQGELRRIEIVEVEPQALESFDGGQTIGCLIGPGSFENLAGTVELARLHFGAGLIGIVLENETYAASAVALRKQFNLPIMPLGDLAQLVSFAIDCDARAASGGAANRNRGVVGVIQLKGGVGTTTVTSSLASCWARHGLTVAMVDLDDVGPTLTEWARVGSAQRTVCAELLRQGEVPANRINELLHPVEGFEGRLFVVGQPERYNESFHFKADVLEGAPSSAEFIYSLISHLRAEFDAVIIDMGRSWGVSTFAAFPLCQQIMLVTDDDGLSVRRTLDGLQRLKKESDDPEEFDLTRWSLILNAYTGRLLSPKELAVAIRDMELFPAESALYTIPFSEKGRQWGAPGVTMYDIGDEKTQYVFKKIAYNLIPFRFDAGAEQPFMGKILKKWQSLIKAA